MTWEACMGSRRSFATLTCFFALFAGPALFAQIDRAVLEGTVMDPTGAAIVGARVETTAVDTGITEQQQTNPSGYYRFPGLPVGRYTITVSSDRFKTKVIHEVVLRIGQIHTLDVDLEVGAIAER